MASGEPRRQIPDSAVYSRDDIEYDESDFLGSGAYSEVFEGRLKHKGPSGDHDGTSTTVAVKVLVDKRQRKEYASPFCFKRVVTRSIFTGLLSFCSGKQASYFLYRSIRTSSTALGSLSRPISLLFCLSV